MRIPLPLPRSARAILSVATALLLTVGACDDDEEVTPAEPMPVSIDELRAGDWYYASQRVNGTTRDFDTTVCFTWLQFGETAIDLSTEERSTPEFSCRGSFVHDDGNPYTYDGDTLAIERVFNGTPLTDRYVVRLLPGERLELDNVGGFNAGNPVNGKWHYFRRR